MESSTINIAVKADTTKFTAAIDKTEARAAKFKEAWTGSITAVSTAFLAVNTAVQQFVIAPLSGAVNAFVGLGDSLAKTSQRIGLSTESLGGLKYAAEQCGSNFDEATDAIKTFQEQLGAAKLGDNGAIGKLGAVGIDAKDFEGLSNEEQFMKLADHIASIGDRAKQTRTAIELFGEAGYKLLPFFQEGSVGIRKLMEEGKTIGAVLGEEGVDSAVNLADAMNRLKTSAASIGNTFMATLAPSITSVLDTLTDLTKWVTKFVTDYGTAIASIGASVAVFAGYKTAVTALTAALPAVTTGIKAIGLAVAANPLLAGGALAVGALVTAFTMWNKSIEESEKKLYALNDAAMKHRETVEAAITADTEMMSRLQELATLSETDTLNNNEILEATKLIELLTERYGDLGLEIDKNTGKIQGMADAQKKMLEQQTEDKKRALQLEIDEANSNIAKLQRQKENKSFTTWEWIRGADKAYYAEKDDEIDVWMKRKQEAIRKKVALDPELNDEEEVTPAEEARPLETLKEENKSAREAATAEKAEAQKKLEGLKEDADLDFRDDLTKAYADLDKRYAEKVKALEERIALTEKAGGDTSGLYDQYNLIEQWKQNELAKIGEGETRKQAEQAGKDYAAWKERNPELNALEVKDQRLVRAEEKVQAAQDAQATAILNGGNLVKADEALEKAKEELAKTVAEVSGEARVKAREELEAAQSKYDKAVAEGVDNKTLNDLAQAVRDAQTKYETENSNYLNAVGSLRKENESELENAVSTTLSSSGTFSAYGMDATVSSNIPQQTLDVLRKLLDNTDEIKAEQKNDGAFTK